MSERREPVETLPDPVSEVLRDTVDEARINRIWAGMEARPRRTGVRPAVWAVPVIAAAAALALFWAWPRDVAPPEVAALTLSSGAPLAELRTGDAGQTVALADGSRVHVSPGSVLSPVHNDGRTIHWRLARGEARFEVRPGGPRQWVVDGGEASATVLGTVFSVRRAPGWTEVEVERGRVRVDAANGTWTLTRGQRRSVGQRPEEPRDPEERASLDPETEALPVPEAPVTPEPTDEPPHEVTPPPAPRPRTAAELLRAADTAREAGHANEAVGLLRLAAAQEDADAALAAFTLGRMLMSQDPAAAAAAFERALELPLPSRLAEDASARRVDAWAGAGDDEAQRRAGLAYLARYPEGRHARRVREQLESP